MFKGKHTLRHVVRGTRYSLSNPTIIKMGIGTDGLRSSAKGGVLVTLVVSSTVNAYGWIFDESIGWKEFLLNVSADLVKATIAAAAGYFSAKTIATMTGTIVIANSIGFLIGIAVSYSTSRVTWHETSNFAKKTANLYRNSVEAISNPSKLINSQLQNTRNFFYCASETAGSFVLSSIQKEAERRASGFFGNISPFNIR